MFNPLPVLGLVLVLAVLLIGLPRAVVAQEPDEGVNAQNTLDTAFTYQGHLNDGGNPVNNDYDFEIILYDTTSGGNQVISIVTLSDVLVSDGVFAASSTLSLACIMKP